jgi:hypothetical protein
MNRLIAVVVEAGGVAARTDYTAHVAHELSRCAGEADNVMPARLPAARLLDFQKAAQQIGPQPVQLAVTRLRLLP